LNRVWWAVVVDPPGGTGYGLVQFGDAHRSCFFDSLRWGSVGGLATPAPGDRIAVASGWPCLMALWPLGAGVPAGVPGLNWS
jgi:hypothetical protein